MDSARLSICPDQNIGQHRALCFIRTRRCTIRHRFKDNPNIGQ